MYIHLWAKQIEFDAEWEYIDTADDDNPKEFLLANYKQAFGPGWLFEWRTEDQ